MKKILSILVIAAMLLAALCVTASAGAFFERNDGAISYKDAKVQVKKSYSVKIDGVVSPGEYEEYTGQVRKIDPIERTVIFLAANGRSAGKTIRVDDITEIHGELVDYMDD